MTKQITIVENILNANDQLAELNRSKLIDREIFSINLIASPGAGKTSLIERSVKALNDRFSIAVIDGDIATTLDADRAAAAGARAYQINTGGECHLDAAMLQKAFLHMDLQSVDFLIVENVGNLICPANFRLGTQRNVLVASVPEGDDKPYKYPGTYEAMDVILLNKIDLLPYVNFRMDYFERGAKALNSDVTILPISCTKGLGLDEWYGWITSQITNFRSSGGQA